MLLAQFLVLAFTACVWWLARRDLMRRGAEMSGPATGEWERLQETVQTLIADLERRATVAEQRVAAAERRMAQAEARLDAAAPPASETVSASQSVFEDAGGATPLAGPESAAHDARYAPVYSLADAGVTDVGEIARRTGLGHGEVALILGLYARQRPRSPEPPLGP